MIQPTRMHQPRLKRARRVESHYLVPNTNIVLVVEDGKIVTIKRLEWIR